MMNMVIWGLALLLLGLAMGVTALFAGAGGAVGLGPIGWTVAALGAALVITAFVRRSVGRAAP